MTNEHVMIFLLIILVLSIFAPISHELVTWFMCWFAPAFYHCSPSWFR